MRGERRVLGHRNQAGIGLEEETQGRHDGDIGVTDAVAEPIAASPGGAVALERRERARHLAAAALDPDLGGGAVQPLLVEQADGLVGQARGEGGDPQRSVPGGLARREHRAFRRHQAVEIVEDDVTVDQHDAVVEHERRDAGERIVGPDLLRIGEGRPGPMLERQAVERERDADAADERGVVLADEDHESRSGDDDAGMPAPRRSSARLWTPRAGGRQGKCSGCAATTAGGTFALQGRYAATGRSPMNKAVDEREAQVVFEYARDSMFRSTHADGFIGGLTPNGQVHIAFFSERPVLPKRHVFKLNPDGSLGAEVPAQTGGGESITRDMQVDVLMTVQAAERLRNWLDQYLAA